MKRFMCVVFAMLFTFCFCCSIGIAEDEIAPQIHYVQFDERGISGHVFNVFEDDIYYMQAFIIYENGNLAVIFAPINNEGYWLFEWFDYGRIIYLNVIDACEGIDLGTNFAYDDMLIEKDDIYIGLKYVD